ncbi:BTB/POZ domain-containing protein 6-B-like [Sitodiplosis mosellana]|uniref:BTB/POZ domain-containing protein 6-B-like n=1 Tax=Sitodiplosis mosellana TaxID=263140 RepID=UPI00244473D5|nr:BTB/POZ domain-containing protein 6-B-like [Sitodiplosis mosellana]
MTNVLKNGGASEAIAGMYLNEELADVHFIFNYDDDVQKVPANKGILAALSPVFYAMFFGALKEKGDVEIVDADAESFKEFLQFFYRSEVTLTMENMENVVRLADIYDILEHVNASAVLLKSQPTLENLCWEYQLALCLKNEELIESCANKINRVPEIMFESDLFQRCDKNTLKRILDLDLHCKETDVFNACLSWARYACKENDLDETQMKNLKAQLGDCLQLIRFGAMTIEEFSTFAMSNDGFFTPDEYNDIMSILTVEGYEPKIFNQNRQRFTWNENAFLRCQRPHTYSSTIRDWQRFIKEDFVRELT